MSDSYIAWYRERSTERDFAALSEFLAEAGFSLEHPTLKTGILLNVDGDQHRLPTEKIGPLVTAALAHLNVEWWRDADTDLTCSFSYEPLGVEIQNYSLDGLTRDEARDAAEAILAEVRRNPAETTALIIDYDGRTADLDPDTFVLYEGRLRDLPDVIVAKQDLLDQVDGLDRAASTEEIGNGLRIVARVSAVS